MSILLEKLPSKYKKILHTLKNYLSPYSNRVYLVGGCVRDLILDREIKDLDIEVFDISVEKFDQLMDKIGAKGVGKSFFVYKYKDIDLALPRLERKVSLGHRGFEVALATDEKEASRRRDFTMNALMLNIFSGELVDCWGGKEDIKQKTIRVIDEEKFKEDSLRVLRAMQFSSRFGFKIDKKSIEIMQKITLDDLSKERVFWEFEKMFHSNYLHFGLYYLFKLNIAKKLFVLEIDRKTFIKTALELQKNRKNFETEYYPYYFLYIVSKNLELSFDKIVILLQVPKHYQKTLQCQKNIPENIDNCFLAHLALDLPIKKWLGNYMFDVKNRAKRLDVYEKCYDGGIFAKDVMNDGFEGKDISLELARRREEKIRKEFCITLKSR